VPAGTFDSSDLHMAMAGGEGAFCAARLTTQPMKLHTRITNRPYLTDLEPYQEIATSAGSGDVLMLTAPSSAPVVPGSWYGSSGGGSGNWSLIGHSLPGMRAVAS
jgi:hypothetical protein